MAEDLAKHPLLPAPGVGVRKNNVKRARFRRCTTVPSFHLPPQESRGTFPGSKFIFGNVRPSYKVVLMCSVAYLALGATCFYLARHQIGGKKTNGFLDALYFCIVTMTTVGFGDLVPKTPLTKLLTCAFVFSGMAVVGLLLSNTADYIIEKQEVLLVKALHLRSKNGHVKLLKDIETKRVRHKLILTGLFLFVLMIVGTIFIAHVEGFSFVDSFYCVCCTITTLGYGDMSFSTQGGRLFAVVWIVASTICVALFFLYLAELNTEHRQQLLAKWVLTRRMTFLDLKAADLDGDGSVGAAEFIIYKLKEMGKITSEDIALVMEEFEELDVDQSGTLSTWDLEASQSGS